MKILLVRLSSMGDLVHTLPAVEDLARMRPEIELHWLCEAAFAPIAALHPFVRKVHTLAWRQWRKKPFSRATRKHLGCLKHTLRAENYDRVLDTQGLIKSAFFARMAGAPVAGFDGRSARESQAAFFYADKYFVAKNQAAILRNRALCAAWGGYSFDTEKVDFGIFPAKRLREDFPEFPENYDIALTATSRDDKLWDTDYWRTLLQKMHRHSGRKIFLPHGSAAECSRAQNIAKGLDFVEVAPAVSLEKMAQILAHSRSVVGVDTGLLHLANAFCRPTVGIFTATDPQKTGVQESAVARNIGGINSNPPPAAVFETWCSVLTATQ